MTIYRHLPALLGTTFRTLEVRFPTSRLVQYPAEATYRLSPSLPEDLEPLAVIPGP